MKYLLILGLFACSACGKLISIPGLNSRQTSSDVAYARVSAEPNPETTEVRAHVNFSGEIYYRSCQGILPSLVHKNNGTIVESAYIADTTGGYYYNGSFKAPFPPFGNGSGCDVDSCERLRDKSRDFVQSLVFTRKDDPLPVPADYISQLEKIKAYVSEETYQNLASRQVLDAYSSVVYRGQYTISVHGLYRDAECKENIQSATDFQY